MSKSESSAGGQSDRRQTKSARPRVSSPESAIYAAETISRLQHDLTKPKYVNDNSRFASFPKAFRRWHSPQILGVVSCYSAVAMLLIGIVSLTGPNHSDSESSIAAPTRSGPPQYTFTQNITNNYAPPPDSKLKISSHRIRIHFHSGHRHHPRHTFRVSMLHGKWRTEGLPGSSRFIRTRH